ncbi:MAG: hypothetical protein J6K52_03395 [Clostridia bacterium]|nr:hypothetical protein [Clostridia bacterium]
MVNNINPDGILIIRQGGYYYNVSGNDALILNKYLGYKLFGVKKYRTGFPVSAEKTVLKKIDTLEMNYDLIDKTEKVLVSKRFEQNRYEIIDPEYPIEGVASDLEEPPKILKNKNKTVKEKLTQYIDILQGLSEGVNILTGEVIKDLDKELKLHLFEMSLYFDNKLKYKEKLEKKHPQHGKKWTKEEDEQLLSEYKQGKTVKELSSIHQRGVGSIRSRLIKLGVLL